VARVAPVGDGLCIVINDGRVVLGRLLVELPGPSDNRTVEDVMDPGPVTVRADADVGETTARMRARRVRSLVVTNPDGVLLGLFRAPQEQRAGA
jgi:CBS domain-containing protein